MTSFRILGPIEASVDGWLLALGGPRQLKLFAFLVLHANRAVSGDAVSDAVWGAGRSASDNRLSMAITRLRRALDPGTEGDAPVLRTVSGGYVLSIGPGELDADVFQARVQDGRVAFQAGEPARASELLAEALGLWRGPVLAEVSFEDFALPEIRRFEELRLEAFEARVDADLELGRHAQLISELERHLTEHPSRERAACQLMLALYRSGRQEDALVVYQRTRTHLAEQLGLEPGPALARLQTRVLEQAPSLEAQADLSTRADEEFPSGRAATRVPVPPTPTIGRERETGEVVARLADPDVRLVTLTGPGGVGKTRLAVEGARAVQASFPDGVCWVELGGVTRPEDVGSTIARALSITAVPGESPDDATRRHLASKQLLLVIDNFEHLLDATGLVAELVSACPGLTVLATSREALNLRAEHVLATVPLALPPAPGKATLTEVEAADATAMFLATARRRDSRFAINERDPPAIARLCARLDGLPLALELAAGRTGLLSIERVAEELDHALNVLGPGPRDAPARQRTLEATIDWSYRLLDQDQQAALVRFAMFAGGATIDAAQEVTGATADTLEALITKSLLERRRLADGTARLRMLETIRHYAIERLDRFLDCESVRRRHLEYFQGLVERNVPDLSTRTEPDALAALDAEIENILAGLDWGVGCAPRSALRLAGELGAYWQIRPGPDAVPWLEASIQAAGDDARAHDRARAELQLAVQLNYRHQREAAINRAETALEIYRDVGDDTGIADAMCALAGTRGAIAGSFEQQHSDFEEACRHATIAGDETVLARALAGLALVSSENRVELVEEAAELLSRVGNYRTLAAVCSDAAYVALSRGALDKALSLLGRALDAVGRIDSPWWTMVVHGNLGLAKLFSGELAHAGAAFERELRLCAEHGFDASQGLAGVGALVAGMGRFEVAARLRAAASARGYPPHGLDVPIATRLDHDYFAPARARFGDSAWEKASNEDAAFSDPEAIGYALEQLSRMTFPSHASDISRA